MATTADIGAARVHLIADTTDWDATLAQGLRAAQAFGTQAEQAFDRSSAGSRRAATRLLDYVATLGRADTQMERYVRQASRAGVEEPLIRAAIRRWEEHQSQVAQSAAAVREFSRAQEEANRINEAFDANRTATAQREINSLLGVKDNDNEARLRRQADATAALVQITRQQAMAEEEAYGHNADIDRYMQQLDNLRQTAGKTHYEIMELRAAQLGISKQAAPMIAAIRSQNEAMGAGTLSAKQYEWAMRGLPMQFTDIFTSLAAGQNPMMVILQQGGQLKDMFGGIAPMLRAVGGAALGMLNPLTILGGLLAVIAVSAYRAESALSEFAIAGIRSGGFAGTATELRAIAQELNAIENVSLSNASEAVKTLAADGKLTGDNLRSAAEATSRWATVTGDAVDEVTAKFESLARDPLAALDKLNEAEHFLTEQQRERIRTLVEEGDSQQAVTEAVNIYADTVNDRSRDVAANLGHMKTLWLQIKDAISDAGSEVGSFSEFMAGAVRQYAETFRQQSMLQRFQNMGPAGALIRFYDAMQEVEPAGQGAATSGATAGALTKEQTDALKELDQQLDRTGSKSQQYQKAVDGLNQSLSALTSTMLAERDIARDAEGNYSGAGYQALIKRLQEQYKEKNTRSPSGRDATQAIRDQMQMELALLQTQTAQIESQYDRRELSAEDYYDRLGTLAQQELDIVIRSNNEQIAALAGKRDAERQISTLRAANMRAEQQFVQRKIELDDAEAGAIRKREGAYRDYVQTLESANDSIQRQMDAMVARVGMGEREFEIQSSINNVYREQDQRMREIQKAQDDLAISTEEAERRRQAAMKATADAIATVRDGFDNMAEAQGNAMNGARKSWEDWLAEVQDVAGQVGKMVTDTMAGVVDGVVGAINGSMENFDDMLENLHQRILRFVVEQQLTSWLQSLGEAAQQQEGGGGLLGGLMDTIGSIFGAAKSEGEALSKAATELAASAAPLHSAAASLSAAAAALAAAGASGGSGGGSGGGNAWWSAIGSFFTANAQGNAYQGSGLSAYRNQIVSKPTYFPFAKGGVPNVGLMGEVAGKSEAIFPLTRASNGDLGVRVVESDKNNRGPAVLQQTFVVQGTPDRTTREQMAKRAGRESARAMNRSGG